MPYKTFWIEPTEQERCWLRRYRSTTKVSADGDAVQNSPGCPLPFGYHNTKVFLKDRPHSDHALGDKLDPDFLEKNDPRWPTHCDCGYQFQPEDDWQLFHARLFSGALDGKLYTLWDVPAGAMWDATWLKGRMDEAYTGPDGIALMVKLPNGNDWCVDQEASNCTRTQWKRWKDEHGREVRRWEGRTHYCWIRHGDPRTGNIHVDKNGDTCAAGAGSILSGSYHGFLHNGFLTDG